MKNIKQKKAEDKEIAKKRVRALFLQAEKEEKYALKKRYVTLARRIAMKFRTRIPAEFKKRFCKHCGAYFIHGKNVRVRLSRQKLVYYCLECKKYTRHPYIREIKEKRSKKK